MSTSHDYQRVYVWEQPVRWFHWINALAITVLGVTGYLIAHPPAFVISREASFSYWFGTLRFVHFMTAYVLMVNFAVRLYWSVAGNKFANWRSFFPLTKAQLKQIWDVLKVDIFQFHNKPVETLGHNSMAYFTYTATGLLTIFQIITGFALLAPTSASWFPHLFTWVVPLFGSEYTLRIFHYAALWLFVLFTMIHVYLVFYHDYVEGHGVISSMVGGWKFLEKGQARAEQATGMSPWPTRKAAPEPAAKLKPTP